MMLLKRKISDYNNIPILDHRVEDFHNKGADMITSSRLTFIQDAGHKGRRKLGEYLCDCGTNLIAVKSEVNTGHTKSCGCLRREITANLKLSHGKSSSSEYSIWYGIKRRCCNPSRLAYHRYKDLGMCERWLNSFPNFLKDMGKRPSENHSVDRVDNSKGYDPDNCRWATYTEQNRNRKSNRILTCEGVSKHMVDWADDIGTPISTISKRLKRGWSDYDAVFVKPYGKQRSSNDRTI